MGNFDFLTSNQTLFQKNSDALDLDYVPKLLLHREKQQRFIATAIQPLFAGRSGKNLLIRGSSGIGKTAVTRRMLMELDEVEGNVVWIYINCWKHDSSFKILTDICHQLGYKFTHNMNSTQIFDKVKEITAKKDGIVFVFDEIDKTADIDFLYLLLEEVKNKAIILITNDRSWGAEIDLRIKSRLAPEMVEFPEYNRAEIFDILRERIKYAFYEDTWEEPAFTAIAEKASQYSDVRVGVILLKTAGEIAESAASKKVKLEHALKAIENTDAFKIKSSSEFTDDEKLVLGIIKENSGKNTGELFDIYTRSGGDKSMKTFTRHLQKL
ncbi:MAG: AAA family ATPase, partial [archaeon]